MKARSIVEAAAMIALTAGAFSCKPRSAALGTGSREPVKVEVMEVRFSAESSSNSYIGSIEPARASSLSAKHSGTLSSLSVKAGDRVSKGQVIAVIESQTVNSTREMAHATLEQAEDGYRRASQVYESGGVADVKMVEISTQLSKARAAAATADKALEDCSIKAPFDGYISDIYAEEGVELDVFAPIARIMDISELEIHIKVPENELNSIQQGQQASMDVPAAGIQDVRCRVERKGISASALSHSFDCTLKPLAAVPGLMPGMVCRIRMDGEGAEGCVVPAAILQTGKEGRYLWVVRDGRVCRQDVKTGGFAGKGVLISEGLQEGDLVIVRGYQKVSSGMEVQTVALGGTTVGDTAISNTAIDE